MRFKGWLQELVERATRHARLTVAVVVLVAIGCGVVALGLKPSTGTDTFVRRSSADYRATQADDQQFGADPVVILVHGPLQDLTETSDLETLSELEACLDGEVVVKDVQTESLAPAPAGSEPPYGGKSSPCGQLMRHRPVKVVYGPATFLNQAVAAVNRELDSLAGSSTTAIKQAEASAIGQALAKGDTKAQAAAAGRAAGNSTEATLQTQYETLALDYGLSSAPSIDDKQFIGDVIFDATRGSYTPKARFNYLFPSSNAALIQVRLKASLSAAQQTQAIKWIREAVGMKMFRLGYGGRYLVSGEPVVLSALASTITGSIAVLLLAALAVMALVLLLVFRGRLRLLPLFVALAAAAITFGLTALAGATLTMASIAVLPVLIGLSVDYAIQFQSRVRESDLNPDDDPVWAVARAGAWGAPTIAAAALATGTGFLVLLLSPIPMVQGFGLLLVVGVAVAFLCTVTAGAAALVLAGRRARRTHATATPTGSPDGWFGAALRGAGDILRPAVRGTAETLRGAGEILRDAAAAAARPVARIPRPPRPPMPPAPSLSAIVRSLTRHPGRVLAAGLVLAVAGWVADTQTAVQSDITKLVPRNMPALRHLDTLERLSGTSGEIDVLVRARDVGSPAAVNWMTAYETRVLAHFGYLEEKGCAAATLCPALSLPALFESDTGGQSATGLSASQITGLLDAVPAYFSRSVISPNRREAVLAFGINLMPLAKQERVVDYLRRTLHPPAGLSASLAGLPVLAADANASLASSGRRLLTLLAGLLAVGLVLLLIFRRPRRALVPLVPIALATGWSALVVFLIGIPLNPMSASLGALVIAISTEFSVLLSERFGQERRTGASLLDALERAYRSTGKAIIASGVTAIAGFGVLVVSDITMLRDFGFVTVIDLSVSLVGVLLVLPAVLTVAENGGLARVPAALRRPRVPHVPRPRLPRRRRALA